MVDPNSVIETFTGGAPRAGEWRALRQALADRRHGLRRQRAAETDRTQILALDKQIAALDRQVETLQTEEVVAKFVEESIEAALARAPGDVMTGEEHDGE